MADTNPFASPSEPSDEYPSGGYDAPAIATGRGYVRQIPVLAVLMMVQGVVMFLAGAAMAAFTVVMLMMPSWAPDDFGAEEQSIFWMVAILYAAFAAVLLTVAILNFVGGMRVWKYRSRTLALVGLLAGLLTVFTCYCAPTSIALAIYGLIVLFHPSVARAFEMGEQGFARTEIEASFQA